VSSMAAYSVFCYVLHVKDRHNGNILLCRDGAIAHVDFGIMLNVRYAKDVLELKIKLSSEFVQVTSLPACVRADGEYALVLGVCKFARTLKQPETQVVRRRLLVHGKTEGESMGWVVGLRTPHQVIGDKMPEFEDSCNKGYLAIRKHSRQLFQLMEISSFSAGAGTALPCLEGDAMEEVKKRLKLGCSDRDAELHMQAELNKAKEHFSTGLLDQIHNWTHANV